MNKQTIRIDEAHTKKLLAGESVTIKVPKDSDRITLVLHSAQIRPSNPLAEVMDVFFNGRPAR